MAFKLKMLLNNEINLLLTGFDVNATDLLDGSEDTLLLRRAIAKTRLIKEHGITDSYATWIVETWLYALGVDDVERTSESPPPICEDDFVLIEDVVSLTEDGILFVSFFHHCKKRSDNFRN